MPVTKVDETSKFDIVVKSLRRREIQCQVIAVTPKKSATTSPITGDGSNSNTNSQLRKPSAKRSYVKKSLKFDKSKPEKRSKSLGALSFTADASSPVSGRVKRVYKKKNLSTTPSKSAEGPASPLDTGREFTFPNRVVPKSNDETPKKRPYHKKSNSLEPKRRSKSTLSPSTEASLPGAVCIKRAYRKKIPMVPHNTPVSCALHSDTESTSASSLSLYSASQPDKNMLTSASVLPLMSIPMSDDDSSRTSSAFSLTSEYDVFGARRGRRRWCSQNFSIVGEEEKEEPMSEYELERQKNIEENRKMLRQLLGDQGLHLEDGPRKLQDTPRIRKSYTRVPLPPPRPKSARIEVKRASNPVDFYKLEMLLLD